MSEHEFEPVRGLPERLPAGETILWQGSPDWRALALRAFHARKIAIYFAILLAWRVVTVLTDGGSVKDAALSVAWLLPFAILAVALVCGVARSMARAAVYTITNRRVAMRIGVVLEVTYNLPYRMIETAGLHLHRDGTGDIPLALAGDDRIAFAHLWPHSRPWHFANPQPMLRCIPDAENVARILGRALAIDSGAANDAQDAPAVAPTLAAAR